MLRPVLIRTRIRRPECRRLLAPTSELLVPKVRWAPTDCRLREALRFLARRFLQASGERRRSDCRGRLARGAFLADYRWDPAPQWGYLEPRLALVDLKAGQVRLGPLVDIPVHRPWVPVRRWDCQVRPLALEVQAEVPVPQARLAEHRAPRPVQAHLLDCQAAQWVLDSPAARWVLEILAAQWGPGATQGSLVRLPPPSPRRCWTKRNKPSHKATMGTDSGTSTPIICAAKKGLRTSRST